MLSTLIYEMDPKNELVRLDRRPSIRMKFSDDTDDNSSQYRARPTSNYFGEKGSGRTESALHSTSNCASNDAFSFWLPFPLGRRPRMKWCLVLYCFCCVAFSSWVLLSKLYSGGVEDIGNQPMSEFLM